MKYVIVQGDGMGDFLQRKEWGDSCLEAARTPHFDRVAGAGVLGLVHTIPEGLPPGSDVGNLSLFGYDPRAYYTGRSPLEAAAMGVALGPEDVSFRMNLVHTQGEGAAELMTDFSGGHIASAAAATLVGAISEALGDGTFQFYPGVSYRHLLVWRGGLEAMETTPPHDITDQPIAGHLPRGEGAPELLRLMEGARQVLAGHPLNAERAAGGACPITRAWLWGQGKAPAVPSFQSVFNLRGAAISAVDLVRGVATYAGFDIINVPGATGFLDTDYAAKGAHALDALSDHDLVFVHIEAPDEAGHMGNREEKIKAIEAIDQQIVGPLLERLPALGDFKLLITSDHPTPISIRTHCRDAVPFAMATGAQLAAGASPRKYGESGAVASGVVVEQGHTIVSRLLAWPE